MKKIFKRFISAALALCCCGCVAVLGACGEKGGFFSAEVLEANGLVGLPEPEYSGNRRMCENEYTFKCSVNEKDFEGYARTVHEYLVGKAPVVFGTDGGSGAEAGTRKLSLCNVFEDFRTQRYAYTFVFAGSIENDVLKDGVAVEVKQEPGAKPYNTTVTIDNQTDYTFEIDYSLHSWNVARSSSLKSFMHYYSDSKQTEENQAWYVPAVTVREGELLSEIYGKIEGLEDDYSGVLENLDCYDEEFFTEYNLILAFAQTENGIELEQKGDYYDGTLGLCFGEIEGGDGGCGTFFVVSIAKDVGVAITGATAKKVV